jgi:hypothetical protein
MTSRTSSELCIAKMEVVIGHYKSKRGFTFVIFWTSVKVNFIIIVYDTYKYVIIAM